MPEGSRGFGPNTAAVSAMLDHAATLPPNEATTLAETMTIAWSLGRTDDRFEPFVAAIGAACNAAVGSGRVPHVYAAMASSRLPGVIEPDDAAIVALVGVRITAAALVVADLLNPEHRTLLLSPWRAATYRSATRTRNAA